MSTFFNGGGDARLRAVLATKPVLTRTALGPVEFVRHGHGPALLCLHGGMGGHDQSLLLAEALAGTDGFDRIAVSRPGYLGTPMTSGSSTEAQADLMAALLDRLEIRTALVCAVSAGGPSAIQFALRHPSSCAGLVLVSTCTGHMDVPPEVRSRLPTLRLMARIPGLMAFLRWRTARNPARSAARSIADAQLARRTLAHPYAGPLLRALQVSPFYRFSLRLPGTLNDMEQFETLGDIPLEKIETPTLVIHGTGDRIVPFSHGKRVADRAPHAEMIEVEGGEHVTLFTHIDQVRAHFAKFIDKVGQRPPVPT